MTTPARSTAPRCSKPTPASWPRPSQPSFEAAWLIESRVGPDAEAGFLRSVNGEEIERIDLTHGDWDRVVELVESYADLSFGTGPLSVVASTDTAERTLGGTDTLVIVGVERAH